MLESSLRNAEVRGWRTYYLARCGIMGSPWCDLKKPTNAPVLIGLRGQHWHHNPSPKARCMPYFQHRPDFFGDGMKPCEDAPNANCPDIHGCGYYGCYDPRSEPAQEYGTSLWVKVITGGLTILCTFNNNMQGFRTEYYHAVALLWPAAWGGDALLPETATLRALHQTRLGGMELLSPDFSVWEALSQITKELGLKLLWEPLKAHDDWGGVTYDCLDLAEA